MRLRVYISALLAFCSLFLFSCGSDELAEWKDYKSAAGSYTIHMPAPVKTFTKKLETPFGKQDVTFAQWEPSSYSIDKFRLFQVSYTKCPARFAHDSFAVQSKLDKAIEMRKKDFSEEEITHEEIELNGYPARAIIHNESNSVVILKICIANGIMYDLTVIAKKNYGTNREVADFFNSFTPLR